MAVAKNSIGSKAMVAAAQPSQLKKGEQLLQSFFWSWWLVCSVASSAQLSISQQGMMLRKIK